MPTLCVRAPHTAKDIHEVQLEGSQKLYEEWPHTTGTRVTVHEWPYSLLLTRPPWREKHHYVQIVLDYQYRHAALLRKQHHYTIGSNQHSLFIGLRSVHCEYINIPRH